MKTFLKISLALTLLLAIAALMAGTAIWNGLGSHADMTVSINGENLPIEQMGLMHWAGTFFGVLVAGFVVIVVVPLALLVGLGLPLLLLGLGLGIALLAVFSVGALMLSPLIFVLLILWLLLRNKKSAKSAPTRTNPDPTIV